MLLILLRKFVEINFITFFACSTVSMTSTSVEVQVAQRTELTENPDLMGAGVGGGGGVNFTHVSIHTLASVPP